VTPGGTGAPVLITGAAGFLGRNLAAGLARGGTPIIATARRVPEGEDARLRWDALDVTDFEQTRALLERHRPGVVYHLAAVSVLQAATSGMSGGGGPRALLDANVAGTWNVLEAARQAGVSAVVVASSDKQYGALAPPPYDDEDTTAFLNGGPYELSKAQQDQVARLYAGTGDAPAVRVARLANVYGPGDTHWTRIVPGTIRRTVRGEPARVVRGAAPALREYVFVDDAVRALVALADDALRRGNAPLRRADGRLARVGFNVGSGHTFPAEAAIAAIRRVLTDEFAVSGPEPEIVPADPAVFEPGSQFNRLDKLRAILPDYSPRDLENGLRETIPWYLEHLAAGTV
jgi:nucleoside-diphosphate-sugar epimerase